MRIIFLVDAFPVISETFIINQITGLMDLGHEVLIFAADRPGEPECHLDIQKYGLLKNTYYHNDRPYQKVWRVLQAIFMCLVFAGKNPRAVFNSLNVFKYGREALALTYLYKVMLFLGVGKADIIQCHYGPNGNLGAVMKEMGIPGKLVTMFHGYDIRRGIEHGGKIYKKLFEQGDLFLSISQYNYKHLIEFGAAESKIKHHPVGIDLERYAFRTPVPPADAVKILTVSRLVEEKGLLYGIQAVQALVEKGYRNIQYFIVGDGPLRDKLESIVKGLDLKNHVYFLGAQVQEGVIAMLRQSHIFFLPSVAEALPVVLMEAQAVGLPVVATGVGSTYEVVVDGQSGFLVNPKDVQQMRERLEYLINHPQAWPAMAETGRKHVEAHYDIGVLNQRLAESYQELLRKGR